MSDENKDLPFAFPSEFKNTQDHPVEYYGIKLAPGTTVCHSGMSLRDYFAAQAMQGFIAGDGRFSMGDSHIERMELSARCFYMMADAMIKARGE